jgi:adenylate kinase family enzyme
MRRVSVVGSTGSGKTTLSRALAARLDAPHVELDALMHQRDWQPRPAGEFMAEVEQATSRPAWVVDGTYPNVVHEGPVWQRADTVVWLDLPRLSVLMQVIGRTVRRFVKREVLWNGNREPLSNFFSPSSVIAWSWANHPRIRQRYTKAMADPAWSHLNFVRLRSNAEANRWLESISETR